MRVDIQYKYVLRFLDIEYQGTTNLFAEYLCSDKPSKNYAKTDPLIRKLFYF